VDEGAEVKPAASSARPRGRAIDFWTLVSIGARVRHQDPRAGELFTNQFPGFDPDFVRDGRVIRQGMSDLRHAWKLETVCLRPGAAP